MNWFGKQKLKRVGIIVAHPDDETLWAGGTILSNPSWDCFIVCLCRSSDTERAPRFAKTVRSLRSAGRMGDLDDGPNQHPLKENEVESAILDLLPAWDFDLIITHDPAGEYTKHLRHEEISKAVILLWHSGKIQTNELWTFAYEDGGKTYFPKGIPSATIYKTLSWWSWRKKYNLITITYGFASDSWEAKTTPKAEAFWQFTNSETAVKWLEHGENLK